MTHENVEEKSDESHLDKMLLPHMEVRSIFTLIPNQFYARHTAEWMKFSCNLGERLLLKYVASVSESAFIIAHFYILFFFFRFRNIRVYSRNDVTYMNVLYNNKLCWHLIHLHICVQ